MNPNTTTEVHKNDILRLIKETIGEAVSLIRTTYGPFGKKVIIARPTHGMIVDDGVQIARDYAFNDQKKQAIWKYAKEAAIYTNQNVGDGTTTSLILLEAILREVPDNASEREIVEIAGSLNEDCEKIVAEIEKQSTAVSTLEDLKKIARISFDNETIADLIAETWWKVGKNGVVSIDKSNTPSTHVVETEGITYNRGYISPYMVTHPEKMEAVLENPYILVTDMRLTEANDIIPVLTKLVEAKAGSLVIIADNVEHNALSALVLNKVKGVFTTVATNFPPAEEGDRTFLEDIALLTGATVISFEKGMDVKNVTLDQLGRAAKVVVRREETTIIGGKGAPESIEQGVDAYKRALEAETDKKIKEKLETRIARLTGSITIIKVGAPTEAEQKALKYKVEDAVNATRVAFNGGYVVGGGKSFMDATKTLKLESPLATACKQPYRQIVTSAAVSANALENLGEGMIINTKTLKAGAPIEVGVVDPTNVVIAALRNAVSIAVTLLTTSGIIVEYQKDSQGE